MHLPISMDDNLFGVFHLLTTPNRYTHTKKRKTTNKNQYQNNDLIAIVAKVWKLLCVIHESKPLYCHAYGFIVNDGSFLTLEMDTMFKQTLSLAFFFLRFFDLNASAFHARHSMAMISNHKSHLQRQKSKVSPPMFFPPLQFIQKGQCWNLSIQTKAILFNRRASNAKYISFLLNKLSILSSEKKYNIYHIYQEEKCAADVFQLAPFLSKLWKW